MSTIIAIITNIINIIAIVSILTPRIRYSYCCSVTEKPDVMALPPVMGQAWPQARFALGPKTLGRLWVA